MCDLSQTNPVRNTKLDTLNCGRLNLIVKLVHTSFTNDAVGLFYLFYLFFYFFGLWVGGGGVGGESNNGRVDFCLLQMEMWVAVVASSCL